jgi:methionyl-tRNA synthetase
VTAAPLMTTDAALDDELIFCNDCGVALTDAELDECGEQCTKCYAASHFTCCDCGDTVDNDDASPRRESRCETCQETKDEEELGQKMDALKDEARELLETICNDGDLSQLGKAVAALKRLQPK